MVILCHVNPLAVAAGAVLRTAVEALALPAAAIIVVTEIASAAAAATMRLMDFMFPSPHAVGGRVVLDLPA
jgi:hypothetical protein